MEDHLKLIFVLLAQCFYQLSHRGTLAEEQKIESIIGHRFKAFFYISHLVYFAKVNHILVWEYASIALLF